VRKSVSQQSELPISIAVCAWCKPKDRAVELGTSLGAISHGICPRHLKKLQEELQALQAKDSALLTATKSRRRSARSLHPELDYPT